MNAHVKKGLHFFKYKLFFHSYQNTDKFMVVLECFLRFFLSYFSSSYLCYSTPLHKKAKKTFALD